MKTVHLTLQGKGGVGKSFVSALLAQYLAEQDPPVVCIDTDPVNSTLAGYKALDVERIELMQEGTFQERKFDDMMERVLAADANVVIDNGASSFIQLSSYMTENDAWSMFAEYDKNVVVHTVVTGGQALLDTLTGFKALAEQLPPAVSLVVWLNEYFGAIESDGKGFEDMAVYQANRERVAGLVRIHRQSEDTFGKDVGLMLDKKLTFAQALESDDFKLMARSRLRRVRDALFGAIKSTQVI